jgi:hypothetical protein
MSSSEVDVRLICDHVLDVWSLAEDGGSSKFVDDVDECGSRDSGGSGGIEGDGGGSGIGHICIVTAQSGWIIVSHTCGSIISPSGPTRS